MQKAILVIGLLLLGKTNLKTTRQTDSKYDYQFSTLFPFIQVVTDILHISRDCCIINLFYHWTCFSTLALFCGFSVQWFLAFCPSPYNWVLGLHLLYSTLYHFPLDLHIGLGGELGL